MIEKPIQIGNMDLSALTTSHTWEYWEAGKEKISEAIKNSDVVIPEYYFPEYRGLIEQGLFLISGLVGYLDFRYNRLFREVARLCEEKRKEVIVVDPAYNGAFISYRASRHLSPALALALFGGKVGYDLWRQHKDAEISRREFIKKILRGGASASCLLVAGSLTVGGIIGPNKVPGPSRLLGELEDKFRESQVAENFIFLGTALPPHTKALTIYPHAHWERIKLFINDDARRQEVLKRYQWMRSVQLLSPLFEIRRYPEGVVKI